MKTPKNASYKWKFSPVNLMDRARFQDWLNQMARQGLFYHWYSNKVIRFSPGGFPIVRFQVKAPDPNRRYHLYPAPEMLTEPPADLLERYRQYGWTYMDYIPSSCISYFLFATDDPSAAEPNSNPESLYRALRFPVRNLLILAFPTLILILVYGIIFSGSWGGLESSQQLSPALQVFGLLLLALLLSLLISGGFQWLTYFLLRRKIKEEHTTHPSLPRWLLMAQRVLAVIETVSFLAAVLLPGGSFFRRMDRLLDARHEVQAVVPQEQVTEDVPLEDWEPDFDLLTLAEMEGDGSWTPEPDLEVADQLLRFNAADVYQDPGRGVQMWYDVSQAGYGTSGDSSMDLNYFVSDDAQATWELLAGLVQDLQSPDGDLLSYLPDQLPFQRETVPGAEEFLVHQEEEDWDVVALEGDRVLRLTYNGALDLSDWYGEIAAMLTPNS